ncbi:hypothetical protein [Pinisolibacter sp.]|uniref:hypothetical protein n=1 Tax=Pinisolibacter sp. TaxID=2172024 RepID=UPI002FDE2CED
MSSDEIKIKIDDKISKINKEIEVRLIDSRLRFYNHTRIVLEYLFVSVVLIEGIFGIYGAFFSDISILELIYISSMTGVIKSIHWLIWITILIIVYVIISVILEVLGVKNIFSTLFRTPTWIELQNFGNQQLAKISYFAMVLIPIAVSLIQYNFFQIEIFKSFALPINFKITYLISLYVSFALFAFSAGAPKELKLKSDFGGTKMLNIHITNSSGSTINIDDRYLELLEDTTDKSRLIMRALCWMFYILAVCYALILLVRSIHIVLVA